MKRFVLFGTLLLGGCVVQSFYPCYQDNAKVELREVIGSWNVIAAGEDTNIAYKAWVFSDDYKLLTYDDKNQPGKLQATFFKVGNQLFCDFEAGDVEEGTINGFWLFHVRQAHTVAKVKLADGQLTLLPLSFEWFKKSIAAKEMELPYLKGKNEDSFFVTATPEQWATFLAKHASDADAFPQKTAYVLRKRSS
jgi:hypothetical protein